MRNQYSSAEVSGLLLWYAFYWVQGRQLMEKHRKCWWIQVKPETQAEWRWLDWKVILGTVLILNVSYLYFPNSFLPHLVFQHIVSSLSPLNKHHTYKLHAGYFPGLPSLQQHPSGGGSQQYAAGHAGSTLCSHLFTEVVSGQAVPSLLTNKEGISSHSPSYTFSTVWVFCSSSKSSYCFTRRRVAWHPTEPATAGYIHWMLNRQVKVLVG